MHDEGLGRFEHDRYTFERVLVSLGGRYHVYDDKQRPLLFVDCEGPKLQSTMGIYEDETRSRKLLTISQDSSFQLINLSFTLLDESDLPIAYMKREGWLSLLRHTWTVYGTTGQPMFSAQEDSWIKAGLRRIPYLEDITHWLLTSYHFRLVDGVGVGTLMRRYSVTSMHILDLASDSERIIDRRIAIALSILLHTSEYRRV